MSRSMLVLKASLVINCDSVNYTFKVSLELDVECAFTFQNKVVLLAKATTAPVGNASWTLLIKLH